jgi:hypothetical protein
VSWTDEPGWDKVIIISSYNLGDINRLQDTAEVTVEYHVKGKYSAELSLIEKVERIKFKVIKTEAGWKIKSPIVFPHIYPKTLITNLENRIKDETDSAERAKLQNDVIVIKKLEDQKRD